MIGPLGTGLAAAACFVGALTLMPPRPSRLAEPAKWLLRPAVLPFAWRGLEAAARQADAGETFARAQQILHLLPTWTDAHVVFAYRFVTGGARPDAGDPIEAAHDRLQVGLAWLESARHTAGRREVELLQAMAMLPEIAARQLPGLTERLLRDGGSAGYAARYLAIAERISGSAAVRDQLTFLTPQIAAAMLAVGDRSAASAALATGIVRADDVDDRVVATEWAARLDEVVRHLRGESVDLSAVRSDPRMKPLLPYLD